ncbi:MAG: sulfite exporter TauE/SafE family protein [Candidatus Nanopelagicales bacterium]
MSPVILAAIGVSGGMLAGLFGVGGGVVMVPLLAAFAGLPHKRASSTSLLAIVPIAAFAAFGYAQAGNIDWGSAIILLAGGILGGQFGSWLLPRVPTHALQLGFGLFTLLTALRLLWPAESGQLLGTGALEWLLLALVGVAAGVLAALLGVGGGIILVPALVLLAGANADAARGTSLVVVIGTALTASVRLVRGGMVDGRAAAWAGFIGGPAGLLGSALGQRMPERIALALFALLLINSGVRMIRTGLTTRAAHNVERVSAELPG